MNTTKSTWIVSAYFDMAFILAPAILISALVVLFSHQFEAIKAIPSWLWLVLVVGVDAGHVYGTLFRTYLDKSELQRHHALLTLVPLLAWLGGCLLYSIDALWFWRTLAYLAVFHFIRQQYGFMMIYARHDPKTYRLLDKAAIYLATLFPLIYWHCKGRSFNWFIEGDFLEIHSDLIWQIVGFIYLVVLCLYFLKEILLWQKYRMLNVPRNLSLLGTAFSWHVGIIAFDNDLIFTATNIIAHGIPYYGLIWAYAYKQECLNPNGNSYIFGCIGKFFRWRYTPCYLALLFLLAYVEEGLWDGMIWREHLNLFSIFAQLPNIESSKTLVWLVPLLSLPQVTHYILDAYIWRLKWKYSINDESRKILPHQEDDCQAKTVSYIFD